MRMVIIASVVIAIIYLWLNNGGAIPTQLPKTAQRATSVPATWTVPPLDPTVTAPTPTFPPLADADENYYDYSDEEANYADEEPTYAVEECDHAYPDVCIPPGPPWEQGCAITPERNFRVLPPDPQRLDADGDGIGCEPITAQQPAPAPAQDPGLAPAPPSTGCLDAYDTCVPPSPYGDWDCPDLWGMGVAPVLLKSVNWDPYRLDRDGDGWGCE